MRPIGSAAIWSRVSKQQRNNCPHISGDRMSFAKSIQHGKEHRKPYRGSKRFDHSCRNHGGCGYCRGNRTHRTRIRECSAVEQIAESKRG